ncbi:four-helix bundle copper-binding protein [Nocardia higoensis]|uniref:Four-helix bundle copper-binding protein n=1 Tax=Nocardia higoensis TaxID=228599 RepID=A0ABS0D747_9NOCA|nr:four-helix bundle copper-binding protein [Nocardia higoensis]MBF6354191.1 four-helix bundle copper-binding protein [Nocardia higoensis]
MSTLAEMMDSHPATTEQSAPAELVACLEACRVCAQTCTLCADACLSEKTVADLIACIRADLNCADICAATAAVLSRRGGGVETTRALLEACAVACDRCGRECDRHAGHHEHCRICAEACHRCVRACRDLLTALA